MAIGKFVWGKTQEQQKSENKSNDKNFLFKKGPNIVRVVSPAYRYFVHIVKFENDTQYKYGRKIKCVGKGCKLCQDKQTYPLKPRYLFAILDRDDENKLKFLYCGAEVYNGINSLLEEKKDDLGEITEFDVNIKFAPTEGKPKKGEKKVPTYQVFDKKAYPLTIDEQSLIDELTEEEFERLIAPFTQEEQDKKIESIVSWLNKNNKKENSEEKQEEEEEQEEIKDESENVDEQLVFKTNRKK